MVNSVRNDLPYVLWEIEAVLDRRVRPAQPMTSASSTRTRLMGGQVSLPAHLSVSLAVPPLFSCPPPLKDHNRVKTFSVNCTRCTKESTE